MYLWCCVLSAQKRGGRLGGVGCDVRRCARAAEAGGGRGGAASGSGRNIGCEDHTRTAEEDQRTRAERAYAGHGDSRVHLSVGWVLAFRHERCLSGVGAYSGRKKSRASERFQEFVRHGSRGDRSQIRWRYGPVPRAQRQRRRRRGALDAPVVSSCSKNAERTDSEGPTRSPSPYSRVCRLRPRAARSAMWHGRRGRFWRLDEFASRRPLGPNGVCACAS